MTRDVLFLAPLRLEARALRRGAPATQIERIGMGPVRATAARARLLLSETPGRPLVLAGLAGGLDGGLVPGDIVVASSVGSTESDELVALEHGEEIARLLGEAGLDVQVAPIVSSPSIVHGKQARLAAGSGGAIAVDMESLWCAPLASRHPFVVVRAVLDVPGQDLRSLRTPLATRRALRSLVVAARALANWAPDAVRHIPLQEVGET